MVFLRMDNISEPGNASSVSVAPSVQCGGVVCPTMEDISSSIGEPQALWWSTMSDKLGFAYFIITVLGMSLFFWPGFGFISYVKTLGLRNLLGIFLCTLLWLDMTGCLLHIILDNEANRWYPFLRTQVDGFLHHHVDPQEIASRHPFAYACAHMGVAVYFLGALYLERLVTAVSTKWSDARQCSQMKQPLDMLFIFFAIPGSCLMQFAHRWTHTPSFAVGWAIQLLQRGGLLINASEHSIHHISPFSTKFSIMMGWADRIVNPLLENVLHPKHPLWVPIFAAWLASPIIFTSPRVLNLVLLGWDGLHGCRGLVGHHVGDAGLKLRLVRRVRVSAAAAIACLIAGMVVDSYGALGNWALVCHAVVMGGACSGFMSEGIAISVAKGPSHQDHNVARKRHQFCQIVAVICLVAGLACAAYGRTLNGLPPIVPISTETFANNPHVVLGFAVCISIAIQALSGAVKLFDPNAAKWHGLLGKAVYGLSLVTTIVGIAQMRANSFLCDLAIYAMVISGFSMWRLTEHRNQLCDRL